MRDRASFSWGVVGTGDVSRSFCDDLNIVAGARLYGVSSRDDRRAQAFAAEFGFELSYASWQALVQSTEIDVVYIATPHSTHAEIAVAALEAGKHVLIEKPIGVDAAEAERIREVARRVDRFAMEGMWMRFNPAYRAFIADVRNRAVGEVAVVRASFGIPFDAPNAARWSAERRSSTLLDQGIYGATLVRDVLGVPQSVSAHAQIRADGVDLTTEVLLRFSEGRFAHLTASMISFIEPSATVSGSQGWVTLSAPFWATDRYVMHTGADLETLFRGNEAILPRAGSGFVPMIEAVHEALESGWREHPLHTLDDSVSIMRLLDEIRACWSPL